jgi:hypothetical protein
VVRLVLLSRFLGISGLEFCTVVASNEGRAVLTYGNRSTRRGSQAMSKAKITVLLLVILILSMSVTACGFTSQGSQEQNRPAENQSSEEEDKEETILEIPKE